MAELRLHPGHLDAVGSEMTSAATTSATAAWTTVLPAGRDPVSVFSAQVVSARIGQILAFSGQSGRVVAAAGAMLRADARIYADTDTANARALGATGSGDATSMPASIEIPSAITPVAALAPPAPITPPLPGRRIAELLHAGTGSASLSAAAAEMTSHVAELADTRTRLTSATADMAAEWNSNAGHAANTRIRDLAAWHHSHAEHAETAAKAAAAQAENFHQARTAIPQPDEFTAVERRLRAAASANAASPAGRYNAVITDLQQKLAHLNERAVTGYARYAADTDATLRILRTPIEPLDWCPHRLAAAQRAESVLGFDPAAPLGGNLPLGGGAVIVWCVPLASGFRCTNLFTDGTYTVYPSPTDRTGAWW